MAGVLQPSNMLATTDPGLILILFLFLVSFPFSLFSRTISQLTTQDENMTEACSHAVLSGTAKDWVLSTQPKTPGSNDPDYDHIRHMLAPNAILRFGHKYFVSTAPHLQHDESPDDFVDRLKSMSAFLQTWHIDIVSVAADVENHSAVVRAVFNMHAKNDPEVVQNEILFWCQMDESGRKVVESTEFVDPTALMALKPKLEAAKEAEASRAHL